ncbi:MAG: 2-dehydropantoate 2-reductase [Candidatus Eremiobacteraeota bacterium]|nr:2-dehydropantoate 2-reductase [Candidatus Eremiobacteraeota bacterium]
MRVVVFGAGSIGGFIAGMLVRAGIETGVVARGAHFRAIRERGLHVRSADFGEFTVPIDARDSLHAFGGVEYVLIAVKAHQLPAIAGDLAATAGATIVPMINGVPFWYFSDKAVESSDPGGTLRRSIDDSRIIGAVVHASGNLPEPGIVEQSGGARYPIGRPDGSADGKLSELHRLFTLAGFDAPVSPQIRVDVWRKLMGNVSLNPISALNRATVGSILHDPLTRSLVRAIMGETRDVALATGIDVAIDLDVRMQMAEHIADVKTSMLQDVEAHRPLELEPIVGAVVEIAHNTGVAVPRTETVYALVKTLERQLREEARS